MNISNLVRFFLHPVEIFKTIILYIIVCESVQVWTWTVLTIFHSIMCVGATILLYIKRKLGHCLCLMSNVP